MATIVPKKLLVCMIIVGLSACASGTRQTASTDPAAAESQTQVIELADNTVQKSPQEWLAEAQNAVADEQHEAILRAAQAFQREQQWQQSAVLIAQLQRHVSQQELSHVQRQLLTYLEARFAAHEQRWDYVQQLLTPILTQPLADNHAAAVLDLALRAAREQQQWSQAASYQLQLVSLNAELSNAETVWQVLKQVQDPAAIELPAAAQRNPLVAGWLELMQRLVQVHNQPQQLDSAVAQWRQSHSDHPGGFVLERLQQLAAQPRGKILVLLPLTGRYQQQGQAVRDGLLLALANQPQAEAEFIDTNQFDFASLPELLQQQQVNLLIGPLLKPNIALIDPAAIPAELPWLTLNEAEAGLVQVHPNRHFYALDAATEIRQAAARMAQMGYRQPLVLAADNQRGRQQAEVFKQAWQAQFIDPTEVAEGYYQTTEDMKSAVQQQLGVDTSEARIQQVKIAAGKIIVDAEFRSRADIDAVYLIGGIEQTRLLKPFIDVNISPFMQALPVYANSGSHTLSNALSENDLDQVKFTDASWLLPNHPRRQTLTELLQLRRNWGYDEVRLAAFGHDAFSLTQQLPLLQVMPGITHAGLTGELSVQGAQIVRQLAWAQFNGHEVVAADN